MPQYGHITLIVGADGSPLSKRHGSRSVQELRREGFLPDAINNYLARLGHYYEDGSVRSEGAYKNGARDGVWKVYNRKGQIIATTTYKEGMDTKIVADQQKKADAKKAAATLPIYNGYLTHIAAGSTAGTVGLGTSYLPFNAGATRGNTDPDYQFAGTEADAVKICTPLGATRNHSRFASFGYPVPSTWQLCV